MYWDVINYLTIEKLDVLKFEIYQRMYYSILPFRIWSDMWGCCRSQYEPLIHQFCTKLLIKNKKVDNEISKRLTFDSRRNMSADLFYCVLSNNLVYLFFHINCGPDRQRPYSKNNYGGNYGD